MTTTTMGGASVLPTDRPLTAGDVPLLREGDVLRIVPGRIGAGELRTFRRARANEIVEAEDPNERYLPDCYTFVRRPAASDEGVGELVNELRLAACGFFTLKNDRGDYGYFDTLADRIAALRTQAPDSWTPDREEAARIIACHLTDAPDTVCIPITITAGDLRAVYAALRPQTAESGE